MNETLLLGTVESINKIKGKYPGKKEMQKIIYLLQKKGLSLDYSYRFYFYGPYSDALDEDIQRLTIKGKLEIQHDEYTHRITLAESARKDLSDNEDSDRRLIRNTIEDLKEITPAHLELMATIIFLMDHHMITGQSEQAIIEKVNEVKKDKYKDKEIKQYYKYLMDNGYIQKVC